MRPSLLPLLLLALPLSLPARAAGPEHPEGVYSSLRQTPSEDWTGMEIVISTGPGRYYATLQCAGGADASRPLVVDVRYDAASATLHFPAHADPDNECPMEAFTGRLGKQGLSLRFPSGYDPGLLKRGHSFWE